MTLIRLAACCAIFASGLAGCVTHGALVAPSLPSQNPPRVELTDTPFFPQKKLQCGPAALATVLSASEVATTADSLEPLVYLPGRSGSLQVEMLGAPRKFARLSYPIGMNLSDILAEVAAGRPVLVLHNYGLSFWPRWHYAVVVGYDAGRDQILLRSGTTQRQVLSAATFMRAWDNGGRWAMVVLHPGEMPAVADPIRYLEAAAAFEHAAAPAQAQAVFNAAVTQWPNEPLALVGRGTAHYRQHELAAAASDYAAAVKLDPAQNGARNNLAMTLLELQCPQAARAQLDKIDDSKLEGALVAAVRDTRAQLSAATQSVDNPSGCSYSTS